MQGHLLGFHGCPYMLQGVHLRFSVQFLTCCKMYPLGFQWNSSQFARGIPLGFHLIFTHFAMGLRIAVGFLTSCQGHPSGVHWNYSYFARAPLRISTDFLTFCKGYPPHTHTLPLPIRMSVEVLTFYKGTS